jgi:thiamine kinase-like enzyme
MHSLLKVCHNDLHLGNFLLLPYNNEYGYIILIHDFGSAEFRTSYQEMDYEFFEQQF